MAITAGRWTFVSRPAMWSCFSTSRGSSVCWRVVKRQLQYGGQNRAELAAGCPERLTWEFLKWIWTYRGRRRGSILRRLEALEPQKRVYVLRSSREMDRFVDGLADA